MAAIDKVRIIVVGDSGVGKTSLVHLICNNEPIANPYWTIGCSVDVKLHEYRAGTPQEKTYFVELWDVGGWTAHRNSRTTFYNPTHGTTDCYGKMCIGVILVHDLTNRKSQQNLRKWLGEILNRDNKTSLDEEVDYDSEQLAGSSIPILVVGTKLDQVQQEMNSTRTSAIAEECGADEIKLDCTQSRHLAPGIGNSVRLSRFFDKVIERKNGYVQDKSTFLSQNVSTDRRRPYSASSFSKYTHAD